MSKARNHSLCMTKGQFSGEGLTDDELEKELLPEEPMGSMRTAEVHVFSYSVFCIGPGALDGDSASETWKKAGYVVKDTSCKHRNDTAG